MKVLLVSRWLWEERRRNHDKPGFFGELAQAIVARGIDLTILSQASDASLTPEARPVNGLKLHVFAREKRNPLFSPLDKIIKLWVGYRKAATDASVVRRFAHEHGPFDVVVAQCEEPDGLCCALAAVVGRFPPLVTFVHDLRYQFRSDGVRFIRKSSLGFIFQKSARVIANSEQTATWLQNEYGVPQNKIGQCRIHLTPAFLHFATSEITQPDPNHPRILFLGALNRKKAPDVFLRAALFLLQDLPNATFVIVGPETSDDITFRATLRELTSQPQLALRLELLGRLEPPAVIEQIRRASVVCCPSRIETFSRTTIEALALSRPVIVTETTGAAHWVKSTGCGSIIPPDDPSALARAIREWIFTEKFSAKTSQVAEALTVTRAAEDFIREIKEVLLHPTYS